MYDDTNVHDEYDEDERKVRYMKMRMYMMHDEYDDEDERYEQLTQSTSQQCPFGATNPCGGNQFTNNHHHYDKHD